MSLRKSFLAEPYYRLITKRLLPQLDRLPLTPNQFSVLGLVLAATVPVGFFLHPIAGLALMIISGAADTLDGFVARYRNAASDFGAFLDSTLDRISDFFYLTGFWILFWKIDGLILASAMIFVGSLMTTMVSYAKARAEALGGSCDVGWMERGWRTLYLVCWAFLICLFPAGRAMLLWLGLSFYLLLTATTVLQRILHSRLSLANRNSMSTVRRHPPENHQNPPTY